MSLKTTLFIGISILLGCTFSTRAYREQYNENFNSCNYGDPALDLIRDKVVFLYTGDPKEQPTKILNNQSYPTEQEKVVIKLWIEKRDQCNKYEANILLLNNKKAVDNLINLLYRGKITYGEFAYYRNDIATLTLDVQATERDLLRRCK